MVKWPDPCISKKEKTLGFRLWEFCLAKDSAMSIESSEAKAEKGCAIIKISRLLMTNLLGAQQKKLAYEKKTVLC